MVQQVQVQQVWPPVWTHLAPGMCPWPPPSSWRKQPVPRPPGMIEQVEVEVEVEVELLEVELLEVEVDDEEMLVHSL